MTIPICAAPTKKHPDGRTGTGAGYQAHWRNGEPACEPCLKAQTAKSVVRNQQLTVDELARHRAANAASAARRRERVPEAVAAEKRRKRESNLNIIRAAKSRPCADCDVQYPYYVMQFDHRDPREKKFNIGQVGPTTGEARLRAEIAKCDVVCANCHAERTHQAAQSRRSRHAS